MSLFDDGPEQLLVFETGGEYLFSQYLGQTELFEDLSEYYSETEYRFAVPEAEFDAVCQRLEDAYYEPVVVTDLEPYCVVIDRYDEHAEILKRSVATWERRGKRFFLMQGVPAVKEAVKRGAERVSDTDFVVGL
ncbi:MAG: hypothetical protein ACI9CA_001805 [Natronomonas sp.]|jgi:hypothetical protein